MEETNNIDIEVKTNAVYESSLQQKESIYSFLFISFILLFLTSLLMQLISLVPMGINLQKQIPSIVLLLFIIFNAVFIALKKVPTIKSYVFLFSFLVGLVIGV